MSIMTAMPQGAAVEGINPNLLDNWYFVGGGSQQGGGQFPINQRGATSYSAANYTIDRWVGGAATTQVTINANSIQFSSSTQDSVAYWMQYVEETLVGKTVTISAIIDGQLQVNTGTITTDSNLGTTNLLLRTPASGKTQFRFKVTSTTGIAIYAAKLELGDQQTLAKNLGTASSPNWVLNEIPDYGTEVLKCEMSIADNTDSESSLKAVTNKATFISSASDLNDYKQPGIYWWTNAPTNAPATSRIGSWLNGWLYVYRSDDGSRIMQEALYNPASTEEASPMVRMYGSNGWGPWRTIDRSLNADLTLHVNATSGNDSNDGLTAGTALKTINAAVSKIPRDTAGCNATILLAEGTYSAFSIQNRYNSTIMLGRESGASISNVKVQGGQISYCYNCFFEVDNITFTAQMDFNFVSTPGSSARVYGCVFDGGTCLGRGGPMMFHTCTARNLSSATAFGLSYGGPYTFYATTIESTVQTGISASSGAIASWIPYSANNSAITPYTTAYSGRIFVGGRTYQEGPSKVTLFQTQTALGTGTTDVTISDDYRKYTFLEFLFSKNNSSTRGVLYIHSNSITFSAWYSIAPGGTNLTLRVSNVSGTYTQVRISNLSETGYYLEAINAIP